MRLSVRCVLLCWSVPILWGCCSSIDAVPLHDCGGHDGELGSFCVGGRYGLAESRACLEGEGPGKHWELSFCCGRDVLWSLAAPAADRWPYCGPGFLGCGGSGRQRRDRYKSKSSRADAALLCDSAELLKLSDSSLPLSEVTFFFGAFAKGGLDELRLVGGTSNLVRFARLFGSLLGLLAALLCCLSRDFSQEISPKATAKQDSVLPLSDSFFVFRRSALRRSCVASAGPRQNGSTELSRP